MFKFCLISLVLTMSKMLTFLVCYSHFFYFMEMTFSIISIFYNLSYSINFEICRVKATSFFVVEPLGSIISGQSVAKIFRIIECFTFGTSKNKKYQSLRLRVKTTIPLSSLIQPCHMH